MKNVLVTGSSKGIGLEISKLFKESGYNVIDTHYSTWRPNSMYLNLSRPEYIIDQIESIIRTHGNIDILVNNAGISQRKDFLKLTKNDLYEMFNINLIGTMILTQSVIKGMMTNGYGKIVNIASIGGVTRGVEQVHYSASKAGLINFTKSLARLYGKFGINTNCISPGIIDTDMMDGTGILTNDIPCNRIGNKTDVARVVKFLASDEASYINGINLIIDGGLILK